MRVALAMSPKWVQADGTAEDRLVAAHLERLGWEVDMLAWDCAERWESYDTILLRSCWDYHLRPAEFGEWLARLEALEVRMWNPVPVVRWNMDKRYLCDLTSRGVPVVPTTFVDQTAGTDVVRHLSGSSAESFVIKPSVGATAHGCRRVSRGDIEAELAGLDPGCVWLVQPFLKEIVEEGEWSLVWLGGRFSHAVIKRAGGDDFRVQKDWGGTAERVEADREVVEFSRNVLAGLDQEVLYARVDLVRRDEGCLLMELELIEPELFLEPGEPGLDAFVQRLTRVEA